MFSVSVQVIFVTLESFDLKYLIALDHIYLNND